MNLRQCFDKHGCDRGHRHGYDRVYEGIRPQRLLEVGVFKEEKVFNYLNDGKPTDTAMPKVVPAKRIRMMK